MNDTLPQDLTKDQYFTVVLTRIIGGTALVNTDIRSAKDKILIAAHLLEECTNIMEDSTVIKKMLESIDMKRKLIREAKEKSKSNSK